MVLWIFDLLWKNNDVLWKKKLKKKLAYCLKKTIVLYRKLWNFDLRRKKNGSIPKLKL